MKVGVIADLHGDIDNFQNVLGFFANQNVEKIICAGDLVDRGIHGESVTRLIQKRQIPTVRGNHDSSPFEPKLLSNETKLYLKRLPPSLQFDLGGRSVYMAHGSPWDDWQYIYPNSSPDLYQRVASEARANIIILGHTHIPMIVRFRNNNRWILNPGTLSKNCARIPTYAILTIPERHTEDFSFHVYSVDDQRAIEPPFVEVA